MEQHSINELAAALAKAQGEIIPALKDATNPDFKSRYATLPAIREAMRKAFADHGLSVIQRPYIFDGKLVLATILLHESGQSMDCGELSAVVDLTNPQQMGSAITYFRRYALAAISQTVSDEDDDANAATRRGPKPMPRQEAVTASGRETKVIENAKVAIAAATSLADLRMAGDVIKTETEAVQAALRDIYRDRYNTLKQQETTNEPPRSNEAASQNN
jgi:hypothetical protein